MKRSRSTALLIFFFLLGVGLLLYPTVSNYWNLLHQSRAIANYVADAVLLDDSHHKALWEEAQEYNARLWDKADRFMPSEEEYEEYKGLLDIASRGVIAYLEIPRIKSELAVYRGTNESVLQMAVGHVAGSSLPVGGPGTHCVLTGHRGLPSAKLFTHLDKLVVGDRFMIRVLKETLVYEVDQILIVAPQQLEALDLEEGKDLCTLLTCTPYAINTHRLLVRGHRVEYEKDESYRIVSEAVLLAPLLVALIVAAPLLLLLLVWLFLPIRVKDETDIDQEDWLEEGD